jgi:hypothetical protein
MSSFEPIHNYSELFAILVNKLNNYLVVSEPENLGTLVLQQKMLVVGLFDHHFVMVFL